MLPSPATRPVSPARPPPIPIRPGAPLPYRNSLFASQVTAAYMHASGEAIDPHCGAMVELVRDIQESKATVYQAADRIRAWRL